MSGPFQQRPDVVDYLRRLWAGSDGDRVVLGNVAIGSVEVPPCRQEGLNEGLVGLCEGHTVFYLAQQSMPCASDSRNSHKGIVCVIPRLFRLKPDGIDYAVWKTRTGTAQDHGRHECPLDFSFEVGTT